MKLQLNVPGISCGGCVSTVTQAIKAVDANAIVQGDPKTKTVLVETESSESDWRLYLCYGPQRQ